MGNVGATGLKKTTHIAVTDTTTSFGRGNSHVSYNTVEEYRKTLGEKDLFRDETTGGIVLIGL